jgi:hypothetical protein
VNYNEINFNQIFWIKKANCEDSQPHLKQIANGSIILPLIGRLTYGNEIQFLLSNYNVKLCARRIKQQGKSYQTQSRLDYHGFLLFLSIQLAFLKVFRFGNTFSK